MCLQQLNQITLRKNPYFEINGAVRALLSDNKTCVWVTREPETQWHTGGETVMEWQGMSHLAAQGDRASGMSHVEHII